MARTRLAPSPTGALHLGNAFAFLVTWALARREGWTILLRVEDLDGPRVKPDAVEGAVDTLSWLGIDWDEGPILQSEDLRVYRDAMAALASRGLTYPCSLTRREIEQAASAPHADDHETAFPASLRPDDRPEIFEDERTNWRFVVDDASVGFEDRLHGTVDVDVAGTIGDFVIWTKRGQPAYQLAVVVDDHRQGVSHVVRGSDLLDSTGRQLLLYRALGLEPAPAYVHVPLVVGPDGRRLAKRHGDTRVHTYRESGVPPERLVALIGRWCGMDAGDEMDATAFAEGLDPARIPSGPIVMSPEDDQWLKASART